MKVRHAVDEPFPKEEIERSDEMHHQWRTAGKEYCIRPSHSPECRAEQQDVRSNGPDQSRRKLLFLIGAPMNSQNFERAIPYWFGRLVARFAAVQSDERDVPSLPRPFAREQYGILSDCTEIRWQPVANVNEPPPHRIASCRAVLTRSPMIMELRSYSFGFDALADTCSASPLFRALRKTWPLIHA
jgi:hypothetical protein